MARQGSGSVIQGFFPGGAPRIASAGPALGRKGTGGATPLPPSLRLPTSGGQPLPETVQRKMETAFGTSFADVRIHIGHEAAALGAAAFTHGSRIHFAPGRYDPASQAGQRLLGHELAHVVQQRSGRVRNPFGSGIALLRDGMLEAEADRMAHRALAISAPASAPSPNAHAAARPPVAQPRMAPGSGAPAVRAARVVQRMQATPNQNTGTGGTTTVATTGGGLRAQFDQLAKQVGIIFKEFAKAVEAVRSLGLDVDESDLDRIKQIYILRKDAVSEKIKAAETGQQKIRLLSDFIKSMKNTVGFMHLANAYAAQGDLRGLAQLRGLSSIIKVYIDSLILEKIDLGYYQEPVTFGDVTKKLSGFRGAGLHGASSVHGPSLYKGLRLPNPNEVNYAVSQIGPGFYLTEGGSPELHKAYARSVADLSVTKNGGSPYLYRVLLKDPTGLTTTEVPNNAWNNMQHGAVNPGLQQYSGTDLMTSVIVDNAPARQIKVNSQAFGRVMIMPPQASRTDTSAWIKARFSHE